MNWELTINTIQNGKCILFLGPEVFTNSQGDKTHVLISMRDWYQLANHVEEIRCLEALTQSIKRGIREAKEMEAGTNETTSSTKDF